MVKTSENFIDQNYGLLRFFSIALAIYGAFYLFYGQVLIETTLFDRYLELSAQLGAKLTNAVASFDVKILKSGSLNTRLGADDGSYVIVAQGCDASTVFAVLISTLMAWPGLWRVKIPALLFGLLLMYALNIVRIAGMSITEYYWPDSFDLMHEWLLPPLLVLGALAYFYVWTRFSDQHPADDDIRD